MSKKKAKRKKKPAKKPERKSRKSLITSLCVVAGAALVIGIVYIIYLNTSLAATDFADVTFNSSSAYDASKDEVDIREVYNNRYSGYQGSLTLNGDGTFSFWMTVGDPEDGTHSGDYTYDRGSNKIKAVFDSGEKATFKIIRNEDNTINHIEAPYNDYTVWFEPADSAR